MRRLLAALTLCISLCSGCTADSAVRAPTAQQDPQAQTVYITRTGKNYHRDGCRHLASSKIVISLKDAKAKGYTPCKVCHPPEAQ